MAKTAKPNRAAAAAEQAPPKRMLVDPRSAEALTTTPYLNARGSGLPEAAWRDDATQQDGGQYCVRVYFLTQKTQFFSPGSVLKFIERAKINVFGRLVGRLLDG